MESGHLEISYDSDDDIAPTQNKARSGKTLWKRLPNIPWTILIVCPVSLIIGGLIGSLYRRPGKMVIIQIQMEHH